MDKEEEQHVCLELCYTKVEYYLVCDFILDILE